MTAFKLKSFSAPSLRGAREKALAFTIASNIDFLDGTAFVVQVRHPTKTRTAAITICYHTALAAAARSDQAPLKIS